VLEHLVFEKLRLCYLLSR